MKSQTFIVTGVQLQSCREILVSFNCAWYAFFTNNKRRLCALRSFVLLSVSQCQRLNSLTNVHEIRDWRSLQKVEQV